MAYLHPDKAYGLGRLFVSGDAPPRPPGNLVENLAREMAVNHAYRQTGGTLAPDAPTDPRGLHYPATGAHYPGPPPRSPAPSGPPRRY